MWEVLKNFKSIKAEFTRKGATIIIAIRIHTVRLLCNLEKTQKQTDI